MNSRNRKIIIGVLALFLVLSVGYALFSETLNIGGSAKASGDFDLEFTSIGTIDKKGYTDETNKDGANIAVISNDKNTLTITVNKLNYPGAYVKIPVVITNKGSIAANLKEIKETGLTEDNRAIKVSYEGKAVDKTKNKENNIYNPNESKDLLITVEWDINVNEISENVEFKIELLYEQSTITDGYLAGGDEQTPETCTAFEKKSAYNVGDVIALCNKETGVSEDFYVVSDNGDTVTMLAKYNLLVGGNLVSDDEGNTSVTPIDTSASGYGLQNSTAIGYVDDESAREYVGVVKFYDTNSNGYWVNENDELLSSYGTTYPIYAYDSNSPTYQHVENYVNYIKNTLGVSNASGKLITQDELIGLGCQIEDGRGSCMSAPSWVYSTSYWSGTALNAERSTVVYSFGNVDRSASDDFPVFGVRPIITINKSEL